MNSISQFRLLNDQVLVEPIRKLERFDQQRNGLFLASNPERDKQREVFHMGRVVKCGPGDSVREGKVQPDGSRIAYACPDSGRWPMHVAEGDIVLYERRPWAVVELEERQFIVMHEEQHLVCVLDGAGGDLTALEYDPTLDRLVA